MDLRSIANQVSSAVNDNIIVSVKRSTGYTIGSGARQIPTYSSPVTGPANVQALDAVDLKQLDGLNIQGEIKAIFLRGVLAGTIRPDQTGGDIVTIDDPRAPENLQGEWLVVKVLEGWSNWTKAAIVKQGP